MVDSLATNEQQLREVLLRLLSRRDYSAAELRQKLRQRGFADDLIEQQLMDVQARGWQSDERYQAMFVRSKISRGDGPLKIQAAAQHKGLNKTAVRESIANEEVDWQALALARLQRRFGEPPQHLDPKQRAKIQRHLAQRGFPFEVIQTALERWLNSDSD